MYSGFDEAYPRGHGGRLCVFVYPFLRRVAKMAGIRVTAPYDTSRPCDWLATFLDLPFLQRRGGGHSFKIDTSNGSAFGAFLRKAGVAGYSRFYFSKLPIKDAIETALSFHLPTSDRVSFVDVQRRPSSTSVRETMPNGRGRI